MKKILILLGGLIWMFPCFSQSLSSQVTASNGGNATNSEASISWSIGEVVVSTGQVHQGYQFALEIQEVLSVEEEQWNLQVQLFPNPTNNFLNVVIERSPEPITLELSNVSGQVVQSHELTFEDSIQLEMAGLRPGVYFLSISQSYKKIKTYKVIKQ